jgi:hypothetical protein
MYSETTVTDDKIWLLFGSMVLFVGVFVVLLYLFACYCLYRIGKKTQTQDAWMAWVPFLNIYYMVKIADKKWWWVILLLISPINIAFSVLVWMEIAKKLKKPDWWGIMIIIPIVNLIFMGMMAFSQDNSGEITTSGSVQS